jgi:hypothetical protein
VNYRRGTIHSSAMRSISLHPARLAIIFSSLLISSASIRAQCSMSTVSVEGVGSVPNNPFQAEIVTPAPPSPGSANFRFPPFPMLIARDSQGRVRSEFRGEGDIHDDAALKAARLEHVYTICDRVAQTMTYINPAKKTATIYHLLPIAPDSFVAHNPPSRSYCDSLSALDDSRWTKLQDLGYQTFEGLDAHGERYGIPPRPGHEYVPIDTVTAVVWCSDELSAMTTRGTNNSDTGMKITIAMQHVVRAEPDPSLFQIPKGYTVTEKTEPPWIPELPRE